jgi:sortase A
MTDRRAVDALSIEEIERILVMKRRAVRRERLQRLAQVGRVINDPPVYLDSSSAAATSDHPARNEEGVLPSYNPFPSVEYESAGVLQAEGAAGKLPEKSRFARIRDRALLALEVLALVGLVTILGGSLANLKTLNEEVAQAREIPTPTVTPLIRVSVLPGGSSPPSAMNDVPVAYRNLVKPMPPMQIPTPGPQRPTRIVIPSVDIDAPVVHGDSWEDLKKGAGHHIGSAHPGERGNLVISAHNDVFGEIFRYLEDVELEDRVTIYSGSQSFEYVVKAKRVVDPGDVSVMAPTSQPALTLITCYPYLIDTHRLVVIAQLDR